MKKHVSVKKLLLIFGIIILLFISLVAIANTNAMNKAVDNALNTIESHYDITPVDISSNYQNLTLYKVMKFDIAQYKIEGVGNLSVMKTNIGVMQMATLVITPIEKNIPLISIDYMYMLGNRIAYIEYYNLLNEHLAVDETYTSFIESIRDNNKNNYGYIKEKDVDSAWYDDILDSATLHKTGNLTSDTSLNQMLIENIELYAIGSKELDTLTSVEQEEKIKTTREYFDGLIVNGGISTDIFKKELGEDVTREFFDKVFFGTYHYISEDK